jgi:hypothetical protein
VAPVVEPDGWQAGPANEPSGALAHGVGVKGLPVLATEEGLVVLVRLAQRQPLLELAAPVLLDDLHRLGVERNLRPGARSQTLKPRTCPEPSRLLETGSAYCYLLLSAFGR